MTSDHRPLHHRCRERPVTSTVAALTRLIKAEEMMLAEGATPLEPGFGMITSTDVYPEVSSADLQEGLDARNSGSWSGNLSSQDVEIAGTSFDSDSTSNVELISGQCTVNVLVTPRKSGKNHFSCRLCPYTSTFRHNVISHIRVHTKERPFSCDVCSRTFTHKHHLTKHATAHTRYKCEKCPGGPFGSKADLAQHMYLHTKKKLFNCSVCSRAYPKQSRLASHMRTHTGDRPYQCSYCFLSFSQKASLVKHTRRHTGERPYACNVCSRAFACKESLLHHAETRHRKDSL